MYLSRSEGFVAPTKKGMTLCIIATGNFKLRQLSTTWHIHLHARALPVGVGNSVQDTKFPHLPHLVDSVVCTCLGAMYDVLMLIHHHGVKQ